MCETPVPEIVYRSGDTVAPRAVLEQEDDHALVQRALDSQNEAFEILMERYSSLVIGFLYNKVSNQDDREELAQEVFLTAYRKLRHLKEGGGFRPWLMMIANSRLVDFYRKQSRTPKVVYGGNPSDSENEYDILDHTPDAAEGPVQHARTGQLRMILIEEMNKLSEHYRDVLFLRLIGEEKPRTIAKRLGIKENTVRMQMMRGLKKLRNALEKRGISPASLGE